MPRTPPPWTPAELKLLRSFHSPHQIQKFLDEIPYSHHNYGQSVRKVIQRRTAHCFDGAAFAAAVFEQMGEPPLLMDLRAVQDTDHILAVFKKNGCYGAVAKSNYSGLRYREPVYQSPRELAMSYFENYFNLRGERTLREFSVPLDLRKVRDIDWRTGTKNLDKLAERLDAVRHFRVLSKKSEKALVRVDARSKMAGLVGRLEK